MQSKKGFYYLYLLTHDMLMLMHRFIFILSSHYFLLNAKELIGHTLFMNPEYACISIIFGNITHAHYMV